MSFIKVKIESLELSITDQPPGSGFLIPISTDFRVVMERDFFRMVYYNILYPYRRELDEKEGKEAVSYKLADPNPWLIALAAVMWEGLIQGLTWGTIKVLVLRALDFLKTKGLAPKEPYPREGRRRSREKRKKKLQIEFSWSEFAEDGTPLKKFFIGIQREFEKRTDVERKAIRRRGKRK